MKKPKYDPSLDQDLSLSEQATYYDTVTLEEGFDTKNKTTLEPGITGLSQNVKLKNFERKKPEFIEHK